MLLGMSVLQFPTDDFEDRITRNAARYRVPIQGEIEITSSCNFRCIHCYVNKGAIQSQTKESIGASLFKKICDQIRSSGCIWLLITGGEPLIHPEFIEMWEYASKIGLKLSLFTNGSLLNQEHFSLFSNYPPESIEISLYALNQRNYQFITKSNIKVEELIGKIKNLSTIVRSVYLKTPLLKQNYTEIDEIQKIAKEFNIGFRMDAIIHPSIHGCNEPVTYRIDNNVAADIAMKDEEMRTQLKHSYENDRLPFNSTDYYLPCSAGVYSFHISNKAKVNTCSIYRNEVADLTTQAFDYGWQKLIEFRDKPKNPTNNECESCKLKIICPHCPAIPFLQNKDNDFIDEYICNYTKRISQISGITF